MPIRNLVSYKLQSQVLVICNSIHAHRHGDIFRKPRHDSVTTACAFNAFLGVNMIQLFSIYLYNSFSFVLICQLGLHTI